MQTHLKMKQKVNFDKHHQVRERASFTEEQPFWLKTPKTSSAKGAKTLSLRSETVKTDSGLLR